jgi:[acyl-carrier-protein] S-malonyltransferase
MQKIGLLFSGQGSEVAGMGLDLYQNQPTYRAVIDQASQVTGLDLPAIMQTPELLAQTQYAQPAIVAMSVGIAQLLAENNVPITAAAGLSLGEYSALIANQTFSMAEGLPLVATRGRLMQQAIEHQAGQMVALIEPNIAQVQQICTTVQAQGEWVAIANVNSPKQIVVGGTPNGIQQFTAELNRLAPTTKCLSLKVSGAFHTQLFAETAQAFKPFIEQTSQNQGLYPVISNTTQQPFELATLTETLVQQMAHATHFSANLQFLAQQGIDVLIEVGPGKTLSKFARQTIPTVERFNIGNQKQLTSVLAALKEVH